MIKRPPIYGNSSLKVAFEFGLVMSEVAKEKGIELTNEMSVRAEAILIKELRENGVRRTSMNFILLVLSVFEV